jgi:anti-sigma B factor antagonist
LVSLSHRRCGPHLTAPHRAHISSVSRQDDVVWYLSIRSIEADGVPVLVIAGRVSGESAPDLARSLAAATDATSAGVVMDLSDVDYISSAGLHVIDAAANRLGATHLELVLCGLQDAVKAGFALAGSLSHVGVEPSRESAVARALRGKV